jgi:hypothetical protein
MLPEALQFVQPRLGDALVSAGALTRLEQLAGAAAPLVQLGLECPLGSAGGAVDLSQRFRPGGEAALLAAHARYRAAAATSVRGRAVWAGVADFAEAWVDGAAFAGRPVTEYWLEFDVDGAAGAHTLPSVFAGLEGGATVSAEGTAALLTALTGRPDAAREDAVARVAAAAEHFDGGLVPLTGVMLARDGQTRVGIAELPARAVRPCLERLGWAGDGAAAEALVQRLARVCPVLWLWLELTPEVEPVLGIDLLYRARGAPAPLAQVVAALVAEELCTAAQAQAVLGWAGRDDPLSADSSWPDALLLSSLGEPAERFGFLSRHVHHLKIGLRGGRAQAKAYLGILHDWSSATVRRQTHAV